MESMRPNPAFDPESYPDVLDAFSRLDSETTVNIWGADWCPDSRRELPDVAAVLEAADVPDGRISTYEVDRDKRGPAVDAYDVNRIPTVVVERDGRELARFEEEEAVPAPQYLASQLPETDLDHF
ncbi:MAG: TlpA family protein disulfide reductase [Halodesulfurarchaeum sp.]